MKHKKNGKVRTMLNSEGFVLTLVVVIMGSVISVVLVGASLSSLTGLKQSQNGLKQLRIEQYTEGCAHDGLIKLNRDNDYSGESYSLREGNCDISVSDTNDGNKKLSVTGTIKNYNYNLNVKVSLNPFKVLKWK